MIERLEKTALCALVASAMGVAMSAVLHTINSPALLARPEWLFELAILDATAQAAVPIVILSAVALFGRTPSTGFCIGVALAWATLLFGLWAKKPLIYYGEFPWWAFKSKYLLKLPLPLSVGLAFAICARQGRQQNTPIDSNSC